MRKSLQEYLESKNPREQYTYKGNTYELIDHVQSKNSNTGEWDVHCLYKSTKDNAVYTREIYDFYSKFIKI